MNDKPATLNPHAALIYVMVVVSAADARMSDAELHTIGDMVRSLPAFRRLRRRQDHSGGARVRRDPAGARRARRSPRPGEGGAVAVVARDGVCAGARRRARRGAGASGREPHPAAVAREFEIDRLVGGRAREGGDRAPRTRQSCEMGVESEALLRLSIFVDVFVVLARRRPVAAPAERAARRTVGRPISVSSR